MTAIRNLTNAPIQEALVDFRVTLPEETELEALSAIHDSISDTYPVKKPIRHGTIGLQLQDDEDPKTSLEHEIIGYRCESTDGSQIVQFRSNGFTYSKLPPYQDWEALIAEAVKLWTFYKTAANPVVINRVATRFINVLNLPLPIEDFSDYLTAPPKLPESLPQALSSFLTRIVLPKPEIESVAIITQALEKVEGNTAPIVIDIDVFTNRHFEINDDEYWTVLQDLRQFKNEIFFESITEKTVRLFQ